MRKMRTASMLVVAAAWMLLLMSCDGGTGLLYPGPYPDRRSWVAIDPVQCLGNPWEQDWLARHGNDYGSYPRDIASQNRIIREYYARFGVDVDEILSIPKYEIVCRACSCPRGDVLYLNVRDVDVGPMLRLGFRPERPFPWPFPVDTTLLGVYRYTGYDSSGTMALFQGTLAFQSHDSTFVSGMWSIAGPEGYGPQTGSGSFTGQIHGNVIGLNLNPGWADNNVVLLGELKAGIYSGEWEVITIAGVVYTGRFAALKLPRE